MIATSIGWGKLILVFAVVMQIASNILVSCRLANSATQSNDSAGEEAASSSVLRTTYSFIDTASQPKSEAKWQIKEQRGAFCLNTFQLAVAFRLSAQIYCGSSLLVCAVTHECAVTWEIPPRNVSCKQRWLTASGPIRTPLSGSEAPTGAAEPNVNTGAKCFACSYFMVEILPKWSSLFTWWSFIYEWGYSFIAKLANVTQGWVKVIFDFWKVIFFSSFES